MDKTSIFALFVKLTIFVCRIVPGSSNQGIYWHENVAGANMLYVPILTTNAISRITCLVICSDNTTDVFKAATYNDGNKECHCLKDTISMTSQLGNRLWNRQFNGFTHSTDLGIYIQIFNNMSLTQPEAEAFCGSIGARLAVLDTEAKLNFTTSLSNYMSEGMVYLGVTDEVTEGIFVWSNGAILSPTMWLNGEPNGYLGEQCIAIHNFKLIDLPCTHKVDIACEML